MPILSGHDLSCSKQDRLLFDAINFELNPSEILYIRGPNGAGKTSLLRILVGLSAPESGRVCFRGASISECAEQFHHQLVYFGHKLGLNSHFHAVENLRGWSALHGEPATDEAIIKVIDELGLVGLEDIPVGQLSAGQQRRVALARLWLKVDAKLWVLDEPFTALDVEGIALLKNKMMSQIADGGSVVLTSHQALELDYKVRELVLEYRI